MTRWIDPTPLDPVDEPWDDERLEKAFRARFHRSAPRDLEAAIVAVARQTRRPRLPWLPRPSGQLAATALAALAALGGLGLIGLGGLAGVGPFAGLGEIVDPPAFEIRPGPPGLDTFATPGWSFDLPSDWLVYDSRAAFSGGSSIAIITDHPVDSACGSDHVDINCAFEQELALDTFRLFVGSGGYRGATILTRPEREGFTTTRPVLGRMPAIRDERRGSPATFDVADTALDWAIPLPTSLSSVIRLEAEVRSFEPGDRIAELETVVASFRFTPPPTPFPAEGDAAEAAAWQAIQTLADGHRRAYLAPNETAARTHYDCFGHLPGVGGTSDFRIGPGGDLGGTFAVTCDWQAARIADAVGEVKLESRWTALDGANGTYVETVWIDAGGAVLGSLAEGDPPSFRGDEPSVDSPPPAATVGPLPTAGPAVAFSVDATAPSDDRPVRVDIVDRSGSVAGARPGSGAFDLDLGIGVTVAAVPGDPRSMVVAWIGGGCDGLYTLTIQADARAMTLDAGVLPGCDAIGIGRAITLTFEGVVAAADLTIGLRRFHRTDEAWYLDLPILTVSEAMAVRDRPGDGREIAVGGWYQPAPGIRCLVEAPGAFPLLDPPRCPYEYQWLMESPEVFDPVDTRGPVGPAFHPIMPIGDQASSGGGLDLPGGPPRLVVFLGHFDDRRSPFCGPDREASCRDRFVVTAVLEVDGESIGPGYAPRLDPPSGDRVDPQSGPGGMRLLMSQVIRPGSRLLSHDPVIGSRLGEVEPGLGDGRLRLAIERVVWVARALDISEQGWIALRTYFVVDGTTNVYEVVGERYVQLEIPVTY